MKNTSINDITGNKIKSKYLNKKYYDNYDLIFRKNKEENNAKNSNPTTNTTSK